MAGRESGEGGIPAGAMWHASYPPDHLSRRYVEQDAAQRLPLHVMLPDRTVFCVDRKPSSGDDGGWDVTGTAPEITVRPSIHTMIGEPGAGPEGPMRTSWHGWLTDGELVSC